MRIYETLENGIRIVEYEDSLAETLADMWNQSREDWGDDGTLRTPGQVKNEHAGSVNINVYVALDGDDAVGYCSLSKYYADGDTLYIPTLSVRPDYQGKKLGKALVLRCVMRTIELGFPRIDLHTWSGNTAAVPMYKKCGYLWEDRPNSTHLVNFMPTILTTGLFADFFKKADWYNDSTRSLDISPDGVKINDFEVFGYTWEKDGESLAVGFERSGRRMRYIETNDYKIELMAEDHKLAFGLSYDCKFTVVNKSGRELRLKITGREDKNIKFDFNLDTQLTGENEFEGRFYVGAVDEPLSTWKVHPCLMADLEINGEAVTFGLGIEAKFPLMAEVNDEVKVKYVGGVVKTYIGISSALLADAVVSFEFPQNGLLVPSENKFEVAINAKGKASVETDAKIIGIGYEAVPIKYEIKLKDGTNISFEKPLHVINQDLTAAFVGETDKEFKVFNGPWQLRYFKQYNIAGIDHLMNEGFTNDEMDFEPPKFGKPYDEEFLLIKAAVKMYVKGTDAVLEADFVSEKFPGMAVTQVFTVSATGIISRANRVQNRSGERRSIMLNDSFWLNINGSEVFKYKGEITQNLSAPIPDGTHYGMGDIDSDDFEENWIFEAFPTGSKGFCWSPKLKPNFQWDSFMFFEIDTGELEPGQIFETEPVLFVYGVFAEHNGFRNYATRLWGEDETVPSRRVDVCLNDFNPFVSREMLEGGIKLDVINNREVVMEGIIKVTSPDGLFEPMEQVNSSEESEEGNCFVLENLSPSGSVALVNIDLNLATYEKPYTRVLFFTGGETKKSQDGSLYTFSNGCIEFKADTTFSHGIHSLTADGFEWMFSTYPELKPFAWWNPFAGGLRLKPPIMGHAAIMKEKITADFTELTDNHGNKWSGIRTTLSISEEDELKGAEYESYFLTLPGLPLLCYFFRFKNNTGVFKKNEVNMNAYLNIDEDWKKVYAEATDNLNRKHLLRFGTLQSEIEFMDTAKLSGSRPQKFYFHRGNRHNGASNIMDNDNKHPAAVFSYVEAQAAPGKAFTAPPAFFLITEHDLPSGTLDDLARVRFAVGC